VKQSSRKPLHYQTVTENSVTVIISFAMNDPPLPMVVYENYDADQVDRLNFLRQQLSIVDK